MNVYIFAFLCVFALIIGLTAITVAAVKSTRKAEPEKVFPIEENRNNSQHIKDFSDINSGNKGKLIEFDDRFDEDVKTTGADFLDNIDIYKENSHSVSYDVSDEQSPKQYLYEGPSPYDEFRTVSFDDASDFIVENQKDYDITVNMAEVNKKHIKVLLKYNDGATCKMLRMETNQATVGRGIGNDIMFISDSFTSRNHGVFTIRDDKLYLKDLNSKNGTYINSSERVIGEVEIVESCEIKFGEAVLDVVIEK